MPRDELDQWLRGRTGRPPAATNLSIRDGWIYGLL
jgi:hypothetical protein